MSSKSKIPIPDNFFDFESNEEKERFETEKLHFDFMDEIRGLMEERGQFSYKELAKILNVSPSFVSQLVAGDKLLNLKMLNKIQQALKVKFKLSIAATPRVYLTPETSTVVPRLYVREADPNESEGK